jgi:hypothetical protein
MKGATGTRPRRPGVLSGLALALTLSLVAAACAGRYGSLRFDTGAMRTFEAAQVLPGHRYYTTGSDTDPAAIVALRQDRPLRGAWREIAATPELLKHLGDNMRGTRLVGPDGAVILDDKGERIGVWYSYYQYPAPPRLLDDGGVELHPPSVPSDGDATRKPAMRD